VVEKLIFVNRFHSWSLSLQAISPIRAKQAITDPIPICNRNWA
jgi:hypothetical protein